MARLVRFFVVEVLAGKTPGQHLFTDHDEAQTYARNLARAGLTIKKDFHFWEM